MSVIIQNPVIVIRKADFSSKRSDSNRFVIRIDSSRELECSTWCQLFLKQIVCTQNKSSHT